MKCHGVLGTVLLLTAVTLTASSVSSKSCTLSMGQPSTSSSLSRSAAAAAPPRIAYAQLTQVWELVLTNGDIVEVPEAFANAPKDAIYDGERAPFLISGDGRHFFYFRKSDGLFVERTLHGRERVVSRKITARYSIDEEWPLVSKNGSYVVMTTSAPGLGYFMDLRTGKTLPPPETEAWTFAGFSPDDQRLLLAGLAGEELAVFDRGLRAWMRLQTRLLPTALANDYVTAAVLVGSRGRYRRLHLLDLRTGRASNPVTVRLPCGRYIDDLDFDQAGYLIVRSEIKTGVAIYRVSKETGEATLLRTIARPDVDVWVLPGDSSYELWTEREVPQG